MVAPKRPKHIGKFILGISTRLIEPITRVLECSKMAEKNEYLGTRYSMMESEALAALNYNTDLNKCKTMEMLTNHD